MFKVRAFAKKARAVAAFTKPKSTVSGWQLEINEKDEEMEAVQIHYVDFKLTWKQVRILESYPFVSLVNLTDEKSDFRYVVASNLVLTGPDNRVKRLKVARKEWKDDELVRPYLRE